MPFLLYTFSSLIHNGKLHYTHYSSYVQFLQHFIGCFLLLVWVASFIKYCFLALSMEILPSSSFLLMLSLAGLILVACSFVAMAILCNNIYHNLEGDSTDGPYYTVPVAIVYSRTSQLQTSQLRTVILTECQS